MRAQRMKAGRWLQPLALITALALSLPAAAELAALVQDVDNGSLRAAVIDSADGSVTVGAGSIADCCLVGAGLTAVDDNDERFYAFGQYATGDNAGDPVILNLSFDGTQAMAIDAEGELQALLAWDDVQERLISAQFTSVSPTRSLQWVSIDPASGGITTIGPELTDCCEIASGLAAVDGDAQQLYFVGRAFSGSDWQLMSVDLADGSVLELVALPPGRPGFLALDATTGQLDVLIQSGPADPSELHRIDPDSGTVSLVATNSSLDCCLVTPGATASIDPDASFWWLAGSGSGMSPSPGFMAMAADNDSDRLTSRSTSGNFHLLAMRVNGSVINPNILFSDRFEL